MLDDFRNLPPIARFIIVLLGIGVIVGIGVVLTFALTGAGKPTTPATLAPGTVKTTAPASAGAATGGPRDSPNVDNLSTIPLPTAAPSTEVPTPNTDGTVNTTISATEKTKAYTRVQKGVEEWCKYDKDEGKTAHLKRIQPYFTADNPESNGSQYIDIIQDQQCQFYQGEPQKILSKTKMTILIYATTVTIYDGDVNGQPTGDNGQQQSVARNTQIYITADKIDGKWQISELDFN